MNAFFGFLIFLLFISLIIGLIKPSIILRFSKNPTRLKVIGFWLIGMTIMAIIGITTNKKESSNTNTENLNSREYTIEETEDISIKALDKNLSSYELNEIDELPINKRLTCRILVPNDIKLNEVKPTIEKIISDITKKDNDIDELHLLLYSDKSLINGIYDVAMAQWAPKEGTQISEIAKSNNRESYETKINIKENLETYLNQRGKDEIKFNLTEEQRKEIYEKLYAAEVSAREEADKKFPLEGKNASINLENNLKYQEELKEKNASKIIKDYKITDDIRWEILTEATSENWSNK
ncbi:hypothetical protein [Flavobacterium sp.]|uniref:hypothetical protein n=1 Tax=Flavobacterium sp. TaxID=239 RepID=UPI0040481522